jgi:outer membrane protein OmpA-like peptidoglycan-associated protein
MSAPSTPASTPQRTRPAGRRLGLLLVAVLAGVLATSTPAVAAAWQAPATTIPGETSTSLPASTAPSGAGAGIDVIPRVVGLVFRVAKVRGGQDTATVSEGKDNTAVDLSADVLFAFDSARIFPAAQAELADTAKLIRERARGPIRVEGHTDSVGSASYNLSLSQRRAQTVRDTLGRLLTDHPTAFSVRGFGATKPVAANKNPDGSDNPKGRAKNRRVTVIFNT